VPFKLANADRQAVTISSTEDFVAANADFFNAHPALASSFVDVITYDTHAGDQSVGRFPDGTNNIYCMSRPTIERANTCLTTDELLYHDQGYEQALTGINDMAFDTPKDSDSSSFNNSSDSASVIAVYSTSGQLMANSAANLRPGLYILRFSNGTSRKVTIR
jgi:hypothetical protein